MRHAFLTTSPKGVAVLVSGTFYVNAVTIKPVHREQECNVTITLAPVNSFDSENAVAGPGIVRGKIEMVIQKESAAKEFRDAVGKEFVVTFEPVT